MKDRWFNIYWEAEKYAKSANLLFSKLREGNNDLDFVLPAVTCAAFSLELIFKSIYDYKYKKDFKIKGNRSHYFYVLFHELDDDCRQKLEAFFKEALKETNTKRLATTTPSLPSCTLEEVLKIWNSVLQDFKYIYESRGVRPINHEYYSVIWDTVIILLQDIDSIRGFKKYSDL
jgi:hypothetical protein